VAVWIRATKTRDASKLQVVGTGQGLVRSDRQGVCVRFVANKLRCEIYIIMVEH
jgi:hypothetical protein